MNDNQQTPATAEDEHDRPLTLAVLRRLVRYNWSGLPGNTPVVLSSDAKGSSFSPFATFDHGRYAPTDTGRSGAIYPLAERLELDRELCELYAGRIPDSAVRALVLYPLG
ncbi:hypothetical protein [Streptomyces dubilierae]|uniref:Uncharacterized protein n=1 Tax=Streptomyces dubilierae TaxID=3075533 RepID=A0ABU2PL79_9ACTN|nr:hypothetical protein [Streptomyces sp. DSM 41921]MDT0392922.1 hypothetical protein [Streptomyces sp. DSM 41921]